MNILSDEMRQIIEHLRDGARLIGPVTVSRATGGRSARAWGFSDGRRANRISVDALAARGLIHIRDDGDSREAILADEKNWLAAGDLQPPPENVFSDSCVRPPTSLDVSGTRSNHPRREESE